MDIKRMTIMFKNPINLLERWRFRRKDDVSRRNTGELTVKLVLHPEIKNLLQENVNRS